MKNKNKLLLGVFTIFLVFGSAITLVQPNSIIESSNFTEDQNNITDFGQIDENLWENYSVKSQMVFTEGNYLSDFEVPEYCTTLAIANDTLFIGTGNKGVYVLNISNPENLVILAHYDENEIYCQEFLIENDILYISEESFGLRVLNVSDIYSITEISFFDQDTTEFVYDSVISEGNMYLTSYNYMLKIVDLADLTATVPAFTVINEVLGKGRKLRIYNDTAYISCERYTTPSWYPYLRWYDLSDPLTPVYIAQIPLKVWDFEFDNGVMYISSTDGIHIYNVSNPNNIFEISHVPFAESVEFELALSDGLLVAGSKYTDNYNTYLMAYNVSDPHTPQQLWNITTYQSGDNGEIEEMIIKDNFIYASQFTHGLVVYDTGMDTDEDGLSDSLEQYTYYTDPTIQDTDEDGLLDGEEVFTYFTDPINNDTDDDLLLDGEEVNIYHSDPNLIDSDLDGLFDGAEVQIYNTEPSMNDTDGDNVYDGVEIGTGLNPTISDSDGDGQNDLTEFIINFGEEASATYSNDSFIQISYGDESIFAQIKTNSTLYSTKLNEEEEVGVCEVRGAVSTNSQFNITLSDEGAQYAENITIEVDGIDIEYNQSIDGTNGASILHFVFLHSGEIQIISIFFDVPFDLGFISGYPLATILISFIGVVFVLRKKHSNR